MQDGLEAYSRTGYQVSIAPCVAAFPDEKSGLSAGQTRIAEM